MKQVHSIGVVCALLLLLGATTPAGAGEGPVYFEDPFFLDLDKDGTRSEGDVFFGPQIIVSFDGIDGEAIVVVDGLELIWGTNGTAVTPPTVTVFRYP